MSTSGFGNSTHSSKKKKKSKRKKPGKSGHMREQCPLGRDPDIDAMQARQTLNLPLSGRLTEAKVRKAHKILAIKHHPDKGGNEDKMISLNNAKDLLLEPDMFDFFE